MRVDTVVFDVGNVLIEWDPRNLFRKLIPDAAEMERFLAEICTTEWNNEQDRGRSWEEAVEERVALFPAHAALIRAYAERWHEMVAGPYPGTPEILAKLRAAGVPDYAITNFNTRTFAECQQRFPFLAGFRDVVVSCTERVMKPEPAIFRILLDRNGLSAAQCIFIDDAEKNVLGARAVGMRAHHFRDAATLAEALRGLGFDV